MQGHPSLRGHGREARTNAALPDDAPAPRLLHAIDDGDWAVLAFEAIDGSTPKTPWKRNELARVTGALPAIAALPVAALRPAAEIYGPMFRGWQRLRAEPVDADGAWWQGRLPELCAFETDWGAAAAGDAFVHGDVRSDNLLLTTDRVVFVDWASCAVGAAWLDAVLSASSVALEGGGAPEEFLALAQHDVPPARLVPVIAAVAGYFTDSGRRADPPGMGTVRELQRRQGAGAVEWLRRAIDHGHG
jgi:aminoglycoside phosphotransferase (APT) family kinase protein